jgi:hypothetical protein
MQIGREGPYCLMRQKKRSRHQESRANARPVPEDLESHDWHLASRGLEDPEQMAAKPSSRANVNDHH